MNMEITPPDYRKTQMRGLWARIGCTDRGSGEFIVPDDKG